MSASSRYRILVIDSGLVHSRMDHFLAEFTRYEKDRRFELAYLPRHYFASGYPETLIGKLQGVVGNCSWMLCIFVAALSAQAVHLGPMTSRLAGLAWVLKRVFRCQIVQDVYASIVLTDDETREAGGQVANAAKNAKREKLFLRIADRIVFLHLDEMLATCERLGVVPDERRMRVIPIAVPDHSRARSSDGVDSQRVGSEYSNTLRVGWWALFSPLHGVPLILDAMSLLLERGLTAKDIHLEVFAAGTTRMDVRRLVEERGVSPMVTIDYELRMSDGGLTKHIQNNVDLALGQFGSSCKAKVVVPNKVVEALSFGVPLLTLRTDTLVDAITDNCALLIPGTATAVADELQRLVADRSDLAAKAAAGRELYLRKYRPACLRANFRRLYVDLRAERESA